MQKVSLVFVLCAVGLLSASDALAFVASNDISFWAYKTPGGYMADIEVNVDGATGVQMKVAGSSDWDVFDSYGGGGFGTDTDMFASLAGLNSNIVHDYVMEIAVNSQTSSYTFSLLDIVADALPPYPTITPVPDANNVPQDFTFEWTWTGDSNFPALADIDFIEVEVFFDSGEEDYDDSLGTSALSWTPGMTHTGPAEFYVGYGVSGDWADLVDGWALDSGNNVLDFAAGAEGEVVFVGADMIEFNVVPEPATMLLLGLGGAALVARRKKQG